MDMLKNFVVFVLICVLATGVFIYSGVYNVAASQPDNALVAWLLSSVREASVEGRIEDIEVPDLTSLNMRLAGIRDFDELCAACHTPPGRLDSPVARGLNPPPPDLTEEEGSPQEFFWITKNGIKMTGMPAWGATRDDREIWPVIAFLQDLPGLDAAGYQSMLEESRSRGTAAMDGAAGSVPNGVAKMAPEFY